MTVKWEIGNRVLAVGKRPLVMGILNVTPDSFSDGGQFSSTTKAVEHALRMEDEGADILDIGGESTRPYADVVAVDEELRRVVPVLEAIVDRVEAPISIDTSKSVVAMAAMDLGAEIINDVTGLEADPEMLNVARATCAGVCAMHMQGDPRTMQDAPTYDNVVEEIYAYLRMRDEALCSAGVDPARICLDPGIGFGKTHQHNLDLIRSAEKWQTAVTP